MSRRIIVKRLWEFAAAGLLALLVIPIAPLHSQERPTDETPPAAGAAAATSESPSTAAPAVGDEQARPGPAGQGPGGKGAGKKGPAGKGPAAKGSRPRDQEPSWLMPPVEGPNLHYKTFDSKTAGEKVSYLIYLPPDYEKATDQRYPVVYWLHGIGGSQQGVPTMTQNLTQAIADGKAPPMIMVFVNGMIRSGWSDSQYPVETVAIKELIPHVDATYRTRATREGRMVEGFSMGGSGAAKWGLKYPDLFGSISVLDGAMRTSEDGNDPWTLAEKNAAAIKDRTPMRIVTRTTGLAGANERFHEQLEGLGVPHEFHKIPDAPHSPNPLYAGLGDKNWEFYKKAFSRADAEKKAEPAGTAE